MTDEDKVAFLRGMELIVGHTPGTEIGEATIKLEMTRGAGYLDYFTFPEVYDLCKYFDKLAVGVRMGQSVTPADRFTFMILNSNKVFDAFNALDSEISKSNQQRG